MVRRIEVRTAKTSFAELEKFGEEALKRHDREGLNRLYHVFWILQNQGEYDRAVRWNRELLAQAQALNEPRYAQISALNTLTGRYDEGDQSAISEISRLHKKSEDWFVRAHAARLMAMSLFDVGRVREGLQLINQAEADIPAGDPHAATAHAGLWEVAGMGLMSLHDSLGAAIAFRRFEIDYSIPSYPRPDFDSLYNLADMAIDLGDLERAQTYYEAHHRLSLRSGLDQLRVYDAGLCAKLAHAKSDALGVIACLSNYGEDLGRAAYLALDVLPLRAIARARTGDLGGALRDRQKLAALELNEAEGNRLPLVDAEILFAQGKPAEAYRQLYDYEHGLAFQNARKFSDAIAEVTRDIQEQLDERRIQLDMARSNADLQRSVIRWQSWIVGIAVLFLLSAILFLAWQWRQSKQLRQARHHAESANRAKGMFLANMSHEIRTPLNGVVAMADVLSGRDLPREEREMVEIIRNSGMTLSRLLSDILDSARIESGQVVIEPAPFDLSQILHEVVALWGALAEGKAVGLRVEVDPVVECDVEGDAVRLRQVLNNLISNALKFTSEGEVSLSVEAMGHDHIRFSVSDTGLGFDDEQRARIFGRFQQADNSITRQYGGSGLGLAISRELVQLMGGRLDCESSPGKGSRFWFDIPLPPVDVPMSKSISGHSPSLAESMSAPSRVLENSGAIGDQAGPDLLRALVADDHPANRKVVEIMLGSKAYLVSVDNGQKALDAFMGEDFDIILMDMQMPVMDGLTATRAIRDYEAETGRAATPILILSANALEEHIEAGRQAGADGHLTKPITTEGLFNAIKQVSEA